MGATGSIPDSTAAERRLIPAQRGGGVAAGPSAQRDFASILGMENRAMRDERTTPEEEARAAAEAFVAKVFLEPVLKEIRESNTQPPPFGPGPGEKEFGALIDAQRSLDLVRSASWPIVDRLAADLSRSQESPPAAARL